MKLRPQQFVVGRRGDALIAARLQPDDSLHRRRHKQQSVSPVMFHPVHASASEKLLGPRQAAQSIDPAAPPTVAASKQLAGAPPTSPRQEPSPTPPQLVSPILR